MSHGSTDRSSDPIEALLRTTGRRTEVPADRELRVGAAVKAHWRAHVRARTRRRWIWTSAGMAAAAVALVIVGGIPLWQHAEPTPVTPRIAARVEVVVDAAWARAVGHSAAEPLRAGADVEAGAEVATEHRGRVALRLPTGHSVRLDTGTRINVISEHVIALERGGLYVDAAGTNRAAARSVEIRTPFGTLTDVGTQFEVRRLATSLRIRVREGRVALSARGRTVNIAADRELEVLDDGALVQRDLQSPAELDWVNAITPIPEIDGRPLRPFLEWIARERGQQLRFDSPTLASEAAAITLNGSLRGMTLDEALESVLSTCRMSYRLEGNILHIRASSESRGRP